MTRQIIVGCIVLLELLLSYETATAQSPIQPPKRFEIYYRIDPCVPNPRQGTDEFDSEKKTRLVDAMEGPVRYTAEWTDQERRTIYEAVVQGNLVAVDADFTNMGNVGVEPCFMGRLRLDIDGQIK